MRAPGVYLEIVTLDQPVRAEMPFPANGAIESASDALRLRAEILSSLAEALDTLAKEKLKNETAA